MNYEAYRLKFKGAVHFGSHSLESGCSSFCADTLFSALCQEALKKGGDTLQQFYAYAKSGQLCQTRFRMRRTVILCQNR